MNYKYLYIINIYNISSIKVDNNPQSQNITIRIQVSYI
jgi:hypothetical protein